MFKLMRRWLSLGPAPVDPSALRQWAQERGHSFRGVRGGARGCVIEGHLGGQAWRIEWGASQRSYIPGLELRLIAELDLPQELMVLVLNHSLMAAMEKTVYEQFVDDVQTRIDTDTPSEMRWLVMFSKLSVQEMGRLQDRYAAVSSVATWLVPWLSSPLNDALAAAADLVGPEQPVALTIGRGRLTLRTALPQPDGGGLAVWFSVFEHAIREARRLRTEWRDAAGGGLTTQPSAWSGQRAGAQPQPDAQPEPVVGEVGVPVGPQLIGGTPAGALAIAPQ